MSIIYILQDTINKYPTRLFWTCLSCTTGTMPCWWPIRARVVQLWSLFDRNMFRISKLNLQSKWIAKEIVAEFELKQHGVNCRTKIENQFWSTVNFKFEHCYAYASAELSLSYKWQKYSDYNDKNNSLRTQAVLVRLYTTRLDGLTHTHTYTRIHTHTHIRTYTHIFTYTFTHTYTQTHT